MFMIPVGIQEASCGIIGNCIGANNVPLAKRFFWMVCKINLVAIVITSSIICFGRHAIIAFYTDDIGVREMAPPVLVLVSINFLFDGM